MVGGIGGVGDAGKGMGEEAEYEGIGQLLWEGEGESVGRVVD